MITVSNSIPPRRIVLIQWKNPSRVEVFSNLKIFCQSYPQFNYHTLDNHLSKGDMIYENDSVRIQRKSILSKPKPNFSRRFFWEFDYDKISWQTSYETVIQRILERGMERDWKELIRFYGKAKIITTLKEEINFLPEEIIIEVSNFFDIKKEEMRCYIWKQSHPKLWI